MLFSVWQEITDRSIEEEVVSISREQSQVLFEKAALPVMVEARPGGVADQVCIEKLRLGRRKALAEQADRLLPGE